MPISSGASGRPPSARLHLPAGSGLTITDRNGSVRPVGGTRFSPKRISASDHALDQENKQRNASKTNLRRVSETRAKNKQMPAERTNSSSALRNLNATSEKFPKRISHISAPSSNSTTSLLANKYFVSEDLGRQLSNSDNNNNNNRQDGRNSFSTHPNQLCDDAQRDRAGSSKASASEQSVAGANHSAGNKQPGLLGSLISLGASHKPHHKHQGENQKRGRTERTTTMKRGIAAHGVRPSLNDAHYSTATTINEAIGQGSINPSMSPTFNVSGKKVAAANTNNNASRTPASSANSSSANLHSLSSLHQQPTTIINRGFNLKYVKTMIIVLMSLDFLITIFVHNFASHDEFLIVFTKSKLRLSHVNLIASAVWFVVLSSAILFDVYFVLVIACMVDLASFIVLLACSVYHFTHRVDYNLVSLTSLLLLLFSIIILHVYLLALAALTIYLTLAVKRRRKH